MEYLNKVELIGRLGDHYNEEQIADEVIRYKFQLRIENAYKSLSGAEVRTVTWVNASFLSHPGMPAKFRGFIFRPKAFIHILGRLRVAESFAQGRDTAIAYEVAVSEWEYPEPKEEEGAK